MGKILIANDTHSASIFYQSCILLCVHDATGAMGLILNKPESDIRLNDLLEQIDVPIQTSHQNPHIYMGGPVDSTHGFILHESSYAESSTAQIDDTFSLTATVGILSQIVQGSGPQQYKIALGYAGWKKGQLEAEIKDNKWLCVDASQDLVFQTPNDTMWYTALTKNGIPPHALSGQVGHA